MSAYIVSDYHINVLVNWAASRHGGNAVSYYWERSHRDVRHDTARIASVLHAENVRSVNARYKDCQPAHGFKYRPLALGYLNLQPVQIIKACHCYAYQACEAEGWEQSEAKAIIDAIEAAAVRSLDGYEDADWSLDEPRKAAA